MSSATDGAVGDRNTNPLVRQEKATASNGSFEEIAKLVATDGDDGDSFGWSVGVPGDGSTAIVGAYLDNDPYGENAGSAYAFEGSSGSWQQQQKLTADNGDRGDYFGYSVAVSGDGKTAIVGARLDEDPNGGGSAHIFERSGSSWTQQQKLIASDSGDFDDFGSSVTVSGNGSNVIIGAPLSDRIRDRDGSAYVFERSGGSWQEQQLMTNDYTGRFGQSVAVSGNGETAIVGAPIQSSRGRGTAGGSAYVFKQSGGSWQQQQKLAADDGDEGDWFGNSVAVSRDGTTAIVGASSDEDPNGGDAGAAYVFERSGGSWQQQQKLAADDGDGGDDFGISVAVSGDGTTAIVGASSDEDPNGERAGSVYVFDRAGEEENGDSGEVIYERDFESESTGTVPSDFVLVGNEDQQVIDSDSAQGDQAYRMSGSHGGCWMAIARFPESADLEFTDNMVVSGYFKRVAGSVGCHSRSGAIKFSTSASSSEFEPTRIGILDFRPDGTVEVFNEAIGSYAENEWVEFEVEYERDRSSEEVTYYCQIDGSSTQSVTRSVHDEEDDLSAIQLVSDDFTVLWDDLKFVDKGSSNAPPIAQFTVTPENPTVDETFTVDASSSDDPDGTIQTYEWDVDDDGQYEKTGQMITHTVDSEGDYPIRLRVTDGDGATDTDRTVVNITSQLAGRDTKLETANLIDSNSSLAAIESYTNTELDGDYEWTQSTIESLETAVNEGEVSREVAEEAIARLQAMEDGALSTVYRVGPSSDPDLPPSEVLNFANSAAQTIIKLAIDALMVIVGIKVKAVAAAGTLQTKVLLGAQKTLQGLVSSLLGSVVDGANKEKARNKCETEVNSLIEQVQNGDLPDAEALVDAVDDVAETIVSLYADTIRGMIELSEFDAALSVSPNLFLQVAGLGDALYSSLNDVDSAMQPSNISAGLTGSTSTAVTEVERGKTQVANRLQQRASLLKDVNEFGDRLKLFETLWEFLKADDINEAILDLLNVVIALILFIKDVAVGLIIGGPNSQINFAFIGWIKRMHGEMATAAIEGTEVTYPDV